MKLEAYLRNKIVKYFNPLVIKDKCEVCGSTEKLEVHHIYMFKDMLADVLNELQLNYKDTDEYTELELLNIKEKILGKHLNYEYMTLCRKCHMNIGHKSYHEFKKAIKDIYEAERIENIIKKFINDLLTKDKRKDLISQLNLKKDGKVIKSISNLNEQLEKYKVKYRIIDDRCYVNGKQQRVWIIKKLK